MPFLIIFLILGLLIYASSSSTGKAAFMFILWTAILAFYSGLIWIWLVFLEGMSFIQWIFGFAVVLSVVPGLIAGLSLMVIDKSKDQG